MTKLFFSVIILSANIISIPVCSAMNLTKFDKDVAEVFKDASSFLLSIVGGLALLVIVISGILYIFAGANPEAQTKAKKTFNYAIIGLLLVLISYAIIEAISNIGI